MSRSEHGRIRDRNDPRDRARKHHIKTRIVSERRHLDTQVPAVSPDAIPIVVLDRHPCVHHPASEADLRGVMARLPAGSLNGVARIELALSGSEREHPDDELDPMVGRLRSTIAPGVYAPSTLGDYTISNAAIRLYGYVYDPAIANRDRLELYLRLRVLGTLIHELGHHQDFMARETRGRWQPGKHDAEPAARAIEDRWMAHVAAHIEEAYPADVAALQAWLVAHIGTPLPLDAIARQSGHMFGASEAFELLLGDAITARERRLAAFYLHYDEHFELSLAVLDHLLAEDPDDLEALTDRVHVLEHLERFAEADAILRDVLARDPTNLDALHQSCASAVRNRAWPDVVAFASRLLALDLRSRVGPLAKRARAHLELGDRAAAARDLGELCANEVRYSDRGAIAMLAEFLRSSGEAAWAERLERVVP